MFELTLLALPADYGEGILSLADIKAHLSIAADETEFDDLLSAFRDAAVDMTERYCGVYLAPRTGVVWTADRKPSRLYLSALPVTGITSVSYLSSGNVETAIDAATLRVGPHGELLPVPGTVWPLDIGAALTVTFNAGFTDENRPPALVQAVRMFTAHLFANREAVQATGTIGGEIPYGFRAHCAAYRVPVI